LFNSSLTCFQVGGIESPLKTPVSGEYSSLFQTHNAKWNRYPWMKRDQGGMLWRDFGQGSLHHTFPTVSVKHNPACRPPCGIGPLRKGIRYLSNRGRLWQRIPLLRRIVTPPYVMDPKRVVYAVLSVKSCSLPSAQAMLS